MIYPYLCSASFQTKFLEVGVTKVITSGGAAADKSGGLVGLPVVSHGLATGDWIQVVGTTNYNGHYQVGATSSTHEVVIAATYVVETIGASARVYKLALITPSLFEAGKVYEFGDLQNDSRLSLLTDAQTRFSVPTPLLQTDAERSLFLPSPVFVTQTQAAQNIVFSGASSDPAREATIGVITFVKDSTDYVVTNMRLPRNFKAGGRARFKLTYLPAGTGAGTIGLTVSYKLLANGAAVPGAYTDILVAAAAPAAVKITDVDFGEIVLTGARPDDSLLVLIQRTDNGSTYTYDASIHLHAVTLAVEIDRIGSGLSAE